MNIAIKTLLLSLCLSLVLGLGGCTRLLLGRSYVDFHDQRHRSAITDTNARLEKNPHDAGLYVTRGSAYLCTRQYEKARSDFNRAIEIEPGNAAAYRGRGLASVEADHRESSLGWGRFLHKGYTADTHKANRLEPGRLDQEINQDFGFISNDTNEFIFPMTGNCIDGIDLILGTTSLIQAIEALPPVSYKNEYGPTPVYRPTKPRIGKVGKVVDRAKYNYSVRLNHPYITWEDRNPFLVFDENNKLVVIRILDGFHLTGLEKTLDETGNERLKLISRKRHEKYQDLMRQYQFAEVYRDKEHATYGYKYSDKTMRGEITPCVTVDITFRIEPRPTYVLYAVEYIYTCSTN